MRIPLNSFSSSSVGGGCDLGVRYLDESEPMGSSVLIGNLFWKNFVANITNHFDPTYQFLEQI